jgi:lipopolysaccharide transport protein LptA
MQSNRWIAGALIGLGVAGTACAQETTVALPPGVAAPVAAAGATGAGNTPKPPKPAKPAGGLDLFSASSLPGGGSSTNGGMQINSDRMEFDYKEMVIAFDGHVHMEEPRYTMNADRVLVFLDGSNQIKRIWAKGAVDIVSQPNRHATCETAVYDHTRGEIVMTGNPVVTEGEKRLAGAKITALLGEQRIMVEGGRMHLPMDAVKNQEVKP